MAEAGLPGLASPAAEKARVILSSRDVRRVVATVVVTLAAVLVGGFILQGTAQKSALTSGGAPPKGLKERREIDKLTAEVKRIRSDTGGSLYWLKLTALFVTVGAAVGGYFVAQSKTARAQVAAEDLRAQRRLEFERRTQVDQAFQAIVLELSAAPSELLRATAAMKLGNLLQAPPVEWDLAPARRDELWSLTKQILAASLAIERSAKVRKTMTIAIAIPPRQSAQGKLSDLDFSLARADDAYWAGIDFSGADFYNADLRRASFKKATLRRAQFRDTDLRNAVLQQAQCLETNFKFTDLRDADLSGANITNARFELAKVHGARLRGATGEVAPGLEVDVSPDGDGSARMSAVEWARAASA